MAAGDPQKSEDFEKVSDVYFTTAFAEDLRVLMGLLNVTRKIEKVPGQQVKHYKVTGSLASGDVAEGAEITPSNYKSEVADALELKIGKYRKQTTFEAIADKGYEQAVSDTDDQMLKDIQAAMRSDFFRQLAKGEGTAAGKGLRGCLAHTRAKLRSLFRNTNAGDADLLYFVNPEDVADFLEDKEQITLTTQDAFGMTYVERFLNIYNLVEYDEVPRGKVYATAKDNLVFYYCNPANTDIAQAFDFYTDGTGYIGVHHTPAYANMCAETYAVTGAQLNFEFIDRMVVASITDENGNPAGVTFAAVENPSGNPKTKGYYELVDGKYVKTSDTTVTEGKTYYTASE